jgi:predicted acylesterase/phospholipase RssA
MSSNLPFFFETFCYDDYKYIDGGIVDNFPISQVEMNDVALGIRTKKVLSVDPNRKEEESLLSQFLSMLTIPIGHIEELQMGLEKNKHVDVISIPIPTYIAFSLNMTNTDKFDLFSVGYETTKKYFLQQERDPSCQNGFAGLE